MRSFVLFCASLLLSNAVSASCNVISVAGAEQWRPFAYTELNGKLHARGIAHDTINLIANDLGLTVDTQVGLPWKRIEAKLDAGELDLLAGHYWTQERSDRWLVTRSIAQETVHVVVRKDRDFMFQSLGDLKKKSGVVPRGISLGKDFDEIRKTMHVTEVRGHEQMYDLLRLDRVDFAVSPLFAAQQQLKHPDNEQLKVLERPINRYDVHLSLSPKSNCVSLFPQINDAIKARVEDGSIQQIIDSYHPSDSIVSKHSD